MPAEVMMVTFSKLMIRLSRSVTCLTMDYEIWHRVRGEAAAHDEQLDSFDLVN